MARSVLEDGDGAGLGAWLVAEAAGRSGWEAAWLGALARFDREEGWRDTGSRSCVDWLISRVHLARSTAFEKVKVAHQLAARPLVAAALASGTISYCSAKEICGASGAPPVIDRALIDLARDATVIEVRQAVRSWLLHGEQDRPPRDCQRRRGLRAVTRGDGLTRIEALLTDAEAAELSAALDERVGEPGLESHAGGDADAGGATAEESRCPDGPADLADWEPRVWHERRADALMDLIRDGTGRASGGDRYLVHVVHRDGASRLLGGEPLDQATAGRVRCDCSTVTHWIGQRGEPLHLGRRRRTWSTAQRRAIAVRDGGHCRWPGCEQTRVDTHHVRAWDAGGSTDVDNGILLCAHHHTLVHEGWTVSGDVNDTLVFRRPH